MKILLVSDIHGNYQALKEILAEELLSENSMGYLNELPFEKREDDTI